MVGRGLGQEVSVKHVRLVRIALLRGLQNIAHPRWITPHTPICVQVNSSMWEVRVHTHEVVVGLLRRAEEGKVHGEVFVIAGWIARY
jgi:hypothetical protein